MFFKDRPITEFIIIFDGYSIDSARNARHSTEKCFLLSPFFFFFSLQPQVSVNFSHLPMIVVCFSDFTNNSRIAIGSRTFSNLS